MTQSYNQYQQPIGSPVPEWSPRPLPQRIILEGQYCSLEPISAKKHADALYAAYHLAEDDRDWTYLSHERPTSKEAFNVYINNLERSYDPFHFTITDNQHNRPIGTVALMRIEPRHGVIEVGHVIFSPLLKQTIMSTEAHFLLMQYAIEQLGYRRYEWKCDSLNNPSRKAAQRLGFQFEGIFRQAVIYKNRNRDTAWFSIIDKDWPQIKAAFKNWLHPNNFDAQGKQKKSLQVIRAEYPIY